MVGKIVTDQSEAFETLKKVLENGELQVNGDIKASHEETLATGQKITVIDQIEFHSVSIVPKEN